MASMKMRGRNFERTILTRGPTSLSVIILAKSEAVSSLTVGFCELQNRFSRYIRAPGGEREREEHIHNTSTHCACSSTAKLRIYVGKLR